MAVLDEFSHFDCADSTRHCTRGKITVYLFSIRHWGIVNVNRFNSNFALTGGGGLEDYLIAKCEKYSLCSSTHEIHETTFRF